MHTYEIEKKGEKLFRNIAQRVTRFEPRIDLKIDFSKGDSADPFYSNHYSSQARPRSCIFRSRVFNRSAPKVFARVHIRDTHEARAKLYTVSHVMCSMQPCIPSNNTCPWIKSRSCLALRHRLRLLNTIFSPLFLFSSRHAVLDSFWKWSRRKRERERETSMRIYRRKENSFNSKSLNLTHNFEDLISNRTFLLHN